MTAKYRDSSPSKKSNKFEKLAKTIQFSEDINNGFYKKKSELKVKALQSEEMLLDLKLRKQKAMTDVETRILDNLDSRNLSPTQLKEAIEEMLKKDPTDQELIDALAVVNSKLRISLISQVNNLGT